MKKNLCYNFYFRQTAILFLFLLSLSFYSFLLFSLPVRFNFVVSERNVHSCLPTYLDGTCILVCQHIWAERAFLFANISGRNVHSCLPTYLGGTCILVCQHIWAERAFLFANISGRNVHSCLPTYLGGTFLSLLDVSERNLFSESARALPCVRAWLLSNWSFFIN